MKCKICGSENKETLTRLCSNMKIMGPFFPKEDTYVVACKDCGHVYVDTDAGQEAFTQYYTSEYSKSLSYREVFGDEQTSVYYGNIRRRIEQYANHGDALLEIGGGIGELADDLRSNGFSDITVMEPSDRCISLCKERGLKTIKSDSFSVPAELEGKFDFIIINHTLEHVLDFDRMLESARRMLKDGGHMYVEVPDAEKYAGTNFVPYWFFTYEHVIHLTLDTWDQLGQRFGFCVSEKASYLKCNSYQVMYAIFEKADMERTIPRKIMTTRDAVARYIRSCESQLEPVIRPLAESREPLILWGVGTSTAQLLNGNFDGCNVVQMIDSNPYRQKITYRIGGRELAIEDPTAIRDGDETILILPLMYDASIRKQIQEMGLHNPVRSLIENYRS